MSARARRWRRIGTGAVLVLWTALVWAYLERLDGRAQDDLFITYRYAQNLAEGEGLVFNPGERVFGLSEPGLGILLAALHRLSGASIPHLGSLVFGLSLLAIAVVVLVAAGLEGRRPEALLGGSVLLAWSLVWVSHGSGAPTLLALLLGAALLAHRVRRPGEDTPRVAGLSGPVAAGGAGVLAGLAVWIRPDAAAALALLALALWRSDRRRALAFGLGGLLVAGLGATAAALYFGSILPQTLLAKQLMVQAFLPEHGAAVFWRDALGVMRRHTGSGWWLFLGVGVLGAGSLWRGAGLPGRLLVLFAAVVATTYSLLGVPLFSWYLVPVEIALVYGFAFGIGTVARSAATHVRWRPRAVALAVAVSLSLPLLPLARSSHRWATHFNGFGRLNAYRDAAEWIRLTTPESTTVAYLEIGVLGYYSRRPLLDLLGLVSPESLPHVRARDLLGALRAHPTDLVVVRPRSRMRPIAESAWFDDHYREAARFHGARGGQWVAVYSRGDRGRAAGRPRRGLDREVLHPGARERSDRR